MLIDDLKAIQREHGYLPSEALSELAERKQLPLYEVHGVATFYPHFLLKPKPDVSIDVCRDLSCHLRDAADVQKRASAASEGLMSCQVSGSSCLGRCDEAVAVAVNGQIVSPQTGDGIEAVLDDIKKGKPVQSPILSDDEREFQIQPYAGSPDASISREWMGRGDPGAAIREIKESGLRGMGGARFPTGTKWELVRKARGPVKYVICNADESEPGTFKDRFLLQHFPDLVIEGMVLAAWCVGASKGTVFIRHEYYRERERLQAALEKARDHGLVGAKVHGSDFCVEIEIFESPGGYICGEETALLEALEGKRAEPRNKPPFPGTHGLWGKPTLINNVETYAFVPSILRKGASWFKERGVNGASGLKFMSVSGDVSRPGVYEVPLGLRAQDLIDDYAGGMVDGRALKAFLPGGSSSGFLPAERADIPLDFKSLADAGTMLGTGAFVAIAEGRDMLELAHNITRFFSSESCGKCVPCRVGSEKLVEVLERRLGGDRRDGDLTLINELSAAMFDASICGLGQAAPNPIAAVIKYFGNEV